MSETRILVVDDEAAERITLGEVLRLEGYRVELAASGEAALLTAQQSGPFDVVVLDLRLPGMDGVQVLEHLHAFAPETVVILITGYGTLETAIQAMRKGAHDYLLKPCPVEEILAAVRRGVTDLEKERHRRLLMGKLQATLEELVNGEAPGAFVPEPLETERFLQVDTVLVDRSKHLVTLHGVPVELTPTEFRLLECLMMRVDEVCTPQSLVRCAQGYEADPWGARSIVRVHIRRLRRKLEPDPERPRYILNVRGVGYMFAANPSEDPQEDSLD